MESLARISHILYEHWFSTGLLAVGLYYVLNRERRNIPPGPSGLPLLGYIPWFSAESHRDLRELGKTYGSVFSIKLGPKNAIIVNDFVNAADVMNNDALQDRPKVNVFNVLGSGGGGLSSWNGQLWREHRRFTLRALRVLGVGKQEIEDLVTDEIAYFLSQVEQSAAAPLAIRDLLAPSTSNIIHAVCFGSRMDYDHPDRKMLSNVFTELSKQPLPYTSFFINFLDYIAVLLRNGIALTASSRLVNEHFRSVQRYIEDETKRQVDAFDPNNHRHFIDLYVAECNEKKPLTDVERASPMVQDIFGAGSATTKDALEWILLYLAKHQDVQEKVVKEISDIIGFDRKPTYADKNLMPYLQAVIFETLRIASMVPINLQHVAAVDSTIAGYTVPKGYLVLINLWAIHHDPKYWPEPNKFDPDRFLSDDGSKLVKKDSFMPFGHGKRSCPGEPLAHVELFAFISSIVQKFEVAPPPGTVLTGEGEMGGIAFAPKDLKLKFSPRGASA